ncbi:RHS repeat-associated core domain-containing protein [Caldimonas brevitalea]|uniref:Type IV secretion protein Rhs n=1 Tax=Caldimonas brevitalea TaxID=413882 RepID=A0A0G3BQD5_9BURK|nr:RHS repeat-associated core domain-containing protein [Caldimonas brevitalea]AKJ29571.1 hypothetical protein AAW51_2880 [Caldimonas brevitalea]
MMPSAKHGDPQLGIDVHLCVVPPSPTPVPLPTPHMSVVFDPFDYVPIIGATVSVFGMKRATAGTGAIVLHIPPGFPFAPMLPEKDDELFMGSATVTADGDPLSYVALPVLGCQVAGMPSPPRPKKKRVPLPNLLPTTFNLAIPTTVKVGGPPTISMAGLVARGAFAGLGKLAKSKFARNLGDRFKKFRQKLFKNMDSGFLKCKVLRAEPVNILSGAVVVEQVDFTFQGMIPIPWVRTYGSNSRRRGACGYGWESPADARLEIDLTEGSAMFRHPAEGVALFPTVPAARGESSAVLELMDGGLLSEHEDEWQVRTKSGNLYHFPKALEHPGQDGVRELPLGRVSDACGNWLTYEWVEGRLVCIRESNGRCLLVEHGQGGIRSLSMFVPETGFSHTFVSYEHDAAGNLVTVRDELGNPYCFAYDGHHMVRHTNRVGLSFHYQYEQGSEDWQVVHAWGDGGLYDYRFAYFPAIREVRVTNSLEGVTTVQCDERGLPILEIDALGGRTIFQYDEAGRTTAVVNAANSRTEYVYDDRGNLLKVKRPDDSVVAIEVDARSKPTSITDPNGAVWEQQWDERGLLMALKSPLGGVTTYEYSDKGLPIAVTDPRNACTRLAYDTDGHLVAVIDALGHATRYRRDPLGNVVERSDPLGRTAHFRYDAKSRLVGVMSAGGAQIRCSYDAQDNLTLYEDENGALTRFEYYGLGLLSKRHQADGSTIDYLYDTEEQLVGVRNERGELHQIVRDALGRVVQEVDYWGQATSYEFDVAGHLKQRCDPLGRITRYATDKFGRVRRKSFQHPLQPGRLFEETFEYDPNGHLTGCANEHGKVQRSFDAEGRVIEERQGEFVVKNDFDALGRRIRRETSTGHTIAYEYDALGRPVSIRIDDEPPILIEHDAAGQVVKETLAPALVRHYRYDDEGQVTAQGVRGASDWLFHTQYAYDLAGNLTQRQDSQHGVDRYRYDPLGQIVEHVDPQGQLRRFFRDPAGDSLRTRVAQRPATAMGTSGDATASWGREGEHEGVFYRFDRAGNLVERGEAGNAAPSDADGQGSRFVWDANQRLVSSTTGGIETRYGYDPLGRRLFKQTGNKTTRFGWDADTLVAERVDEAASAATALADAANRSVQPVQRWEQQREYLYYPGTFVPLALLQRGDAGSLRYHNDLNGAPTRLMRPDGTVVWSAVYQPGGHAVPAQAGVRDDANVDNPIRLQGQYWDQETGLHYNRHRYYDPGIGQFISQDPLGLFGGPNVYKFGLNVFIYADPLGLMPWLQGEPKPKGWRLPKIGTWAGDPGHSDFIPNDPAALGLNEGDRIPYKDGMPDFSRWAVDTFDVQNMTGEHKVDMPLIYERMAAREPERFANPTAARTWLSNEGLTPHHAGGTRVLLVPTVLHGNVRHMGGAFELRGNC